jgi:hypothetical protein
MRRIDDAFAIAVVIERQRSRGLRAAGAVFI